MHRNSILGGEVPDEALDLPARDAGRKGHAFNRFFMENAREVRHVDPAGREGPVVRHKVVADEQDRDLGLPGEQFREHAVGLVDVLHHLGMGGRIEARVHHRGHELRDHPGQLFMEIRFRHHSNSILSRP